MRNKLKSKATISDDTEISKNLKLLSTVSLINKVNLRYTRDEVYEKALRNYDILLDVIENPPKANQIASHLNISSTKIRAQTEKIIDILLFNKRNNPYLALGLGKKATTGDVKKRYKRLIKLFHPDKYLNERKYVDRIQRINEAHGKINQLQKKGYNPHKYNNLKEYFSTSKATINKFKYLKRLPLIITGMAILTAIVSMFLFILSTKMQ